MKLVSENDFNMMWNNFRLSGSQEALSLIYYQYFDFLYDFGLKYTSDRTLIEDSIQNVFGYLLKKRKSLNPVSNLQFYILKSFSRELFDQLKKSKKVSFVLDMPEIPDQICFNKVEDDMEIEERDQIIQLVQKSIDKLGPKQQEIIYLRFTQNLDYSEIAELLKISVDSCYKSVYRSIKFIKDDIEKIMGNDPKILLLIYIHMSANI